MKMMQRAATLLLLLLIGCSNPIVGFRLVNNGFIHHHATATNTNDMKYNNRIITTLLSSSSPSSSDHTSSNNRSNGDNLDAYDLKLFSPSKINLFLRIIRKREDGFHDLASLFQTIGFGDDLYLSLLPPSDKQDITTDHDVFSCNMEGVPTDKSNLVLRAVDLVRSKCGITDKYFDIKLHKNVPAQAGLGGGSANAATALYGVNELLGRPATYEQLVEWSGELGSDITFFLSQGTAYCTGRGEIMTPITPTVGPLTSKCTIVKPDVGLSTPSVFKNLDYDKLSDEDPEELLRIFVEEGINNNKTTKNGFVNDLEPPAFKLEPVLLELKTKLVDCGFDTVMMSGSGTSIFCLGDCKDLNKFEVEIKSREDVNVYETEFISRESTDKWFSRE